MRGTRVRGELRELFNEFFAVSDCRSLRGVTFSTRRKSPKTRTGRGCFDSPSPCEPSPATTKVGLGPLLIPPREMVQCLALPTDFFAKINLARKTTLDSRNFAHPRRESKGNRARFLFGGSRVEVFRRRGNRNPRLLNDSLVTFCSYRKLPRGATRSRSLQTIPIKPSAIRSIHR